MATTRGLVEAMVRGRSHDWVGYFDHGPWETTLSRWVKEGYPTTRNQRGEIAPIPYPAHFGYDMRLVGGWFDIMPECNGKQILEETEDSVTFRNGAGAILRNWKTATSTPEYVGFSMTSREIWERVYKPRLLSSKRERLDIAAARRRREEAHRDGRWAFYGHQFIWENMRCSMGNVCMLESLLADPDWIHDYCRTYTDLYKTLFGILIEEAGMPDGIWLYEDLGYRNDLVCSPETLDKLIFPYYRELIQFFHERDLPVILHSDGRIDKAIPLIIDAGFAAINPIEVKAGCDLFGYAERYGDRIAFIGGFDARILESGDRAAISGEVRRLVDGMRRRHARFMLGVDRSLSDEVSYDSFRFLLEELRRINGP